MSQGATYRFPSMMLKEYMHCQGPLNALYELHAHAGVRMSTVPCALLPPVPCALLPTKGLPHLTLAIIPTHTSQETCPVWLTSTMHADPISTASYHSSAHPAHTPVTRTSLAWAQFGQPVYAGNTHYPLKQAKRLAHAMSGAVE